MDKVTFMKRVALWTAVVVAVVMLACGLLWGRVVEDNLFEEIAKWVVVYLFVCGIFEMFAYILGGTFYHGSVFDPESEKYKKRQEKKNAKK